MSKTLSHQTRPFDSLCFRQTTFDLQCLGLEDTTCFNSTSIAVRMQREVMLFSFFSECIFYQKSSLIEKKMEFKQLCEHFSVDKYM